MKKIFFWIGLYLLFVGLARVCRGDTSRAAQGIVLIIIGILSWKIRIPAMFIIYAVIWGWGAVMNGLAMLQDDSVMQGFGVLFQVVGTILFVWGFRKYRYIQLHTQNLEGNILSPLPASLDEKIILGHFALAGAILAGISLILLAISVGIAFKEVTQTMILLEYLVSGAINIAVLAQGLSCAALVSGYNKKGLVWSGTSMSALVLILNLWSMV